jgi:hypothetical protein
VHLSPSLGRSRQWSGLAVVVAAVALLAAACGGGGSKATAATTPTTASGSPASAGFAAYRECLAQHGVKLPANFAPRRNANGNGNPTLGTRPPGDTGPSLPPGVDAATFRAARQACRDKQPAGAFRRNSTAFQAYVSCLRDHGVTVPTTVAGGPPPSIDRSSPAFQQANNTCRALLPQRPFGSTTTVPVSS